MSAGPKTSGLAIAAIIFTFLCWPLGLILGIIALVTIGNSNGAIGGKGLALASVIVSALMIPIMGIMAAIAIPNFIRYQLRSKSSEARLNLRSIQSAQEMAHAEWNRYVSIPAQGDRPGTERSPWAAEDCSPGCSAESPQECASFSCINFRPGSAVYYQYACEASPDGQDFTCAALGDLDGDGAMSMYVVGTNKAGGSQLVAPIPDFGGAAPACPAAEPGLVVNCDRQEF